MPTYSAGKHRYVKFLIPSSSVLFQFPFTAINLVALHLSSELLTWWCGKNFHTFLVVRFRFDWLLGKESLFERVSRIMCKNVRSVIERYRLYFTIAIARLNLTLILGGFDCFLKYMILDHNNKLRLKNQSDLCTLQAVSSQWILITGFHQNYWKAFMFYFCRRVVEPRITVNLCTTTTTQVTLVQQLQAK